MQGNEKSDASDNKESNAGVFDERRLWHIQLIVRVIGRKEDRVNRSPKISLLHDDDGGIFFPLLLQPSFVVVGMALIVEQGKLPPKEPKA